jgi:hypothetical protein
MGKGGPPAFNCDYGADLARWSLVAVSAYVSVLATLLAAGLRLGDGVGGWWLAGSWLLNQMWPASVS